MSAAWDPQNVFVLCATVSFCVFVVTLGTCATLESKWSAEVAMAQARCAVDGGSR